MNWALAISRLSLLVISQCWRFLSSSKFTAFSRSINVLAAKVILVSSAKILGEAEVRQLGRSLTYTKNRSGPRLLPYGTPQETGAVFDKWPFVLHFWFQSQRYDSNHLRLLESTPYFRSFCIRIVWSMVSKAFFRSMKITPFTRQLSILNDQLLVASINAVSVLCNDRNPDWQWVSKLLSKIITKLVVYNFFENFGNGRNNGYWLIIVWVIPFALFENRSYSSEFPLSWKNARLVLIDFINNWVSNGAIILLAILRSLDAMLPEPAAFLSFSLANSLRTMLTGGSFREKVVLIASR